MHIGPISVLIWLPMDKEWQDPRLFLVRTVIAVRNFNSFCCDSSLEQLIHCTTDLESLSLQAHWSHLCAHLVTNGQGMARPDAFSCPYRQQ
jgi:hypothetical protein